MAANDALRIGQLSVYFGLFDAAMPPEFRRERTAFAEQVGRLLSSFGEVIYPGVVDSDEAGRAAGRQFAAADLDVVVFAPTMAAPPSYGWEAVRELTGIPIVAVGAQELETVPDDYSTEEGTRRSLPVGLVMFTNVLVREEREFTTLIGLLASPDFEHRLADSLRAAAAAGRVRSARLLSVGQPIAGYLDVEASPEALARLGVDVVAVEAAEVAGAFAAVEETAVEDLAADLRKRFDATAVIDETLLRSSRLALALDRLCDQHQVAAGSVNCHSDVLRWNPEVGITACLGVSRCSERGVPFSCTGDVPTALALLIGKNVAGAALYCELYQLDFPGDWVLVANGGEGDLAIRDERWPVRLLPEDHYMGDQGPGTAVAFALPPGPATLISLSPVAGGWVLVGAEGEVLDSRHHDMEGPNAMFRFASGAVAEGYARWCRAGATHHAAALPGHRGAVLAETAAMLGIGFATV